MNFYERDLNPSRRRSDRYRKCEVLKDVETGETLLSTREIPTIQYNKLDVVHTLTGNEPNRLDLLAFKYYKNPLLYWVIAEANGIADPFAAIPVGTRIRIPNLDNLYTDGGVLV